MQAWYEYMDVANQERIEEGREMMRKQMHEMAEKIEVEGERGKDLAQREANRRLEMCKRTVKRMMQHHLSMAWNEFVENVYTAVDRLHGHNFGGTCRGCQGTGKAGTFEGEGGTRGCTFFRPCPCRAETFK